MQSHSSLSPMDRELPLRITVVRPLPGVAVQIQRGRSELLSPTNETNDTISFRFAVRVRHPRGDEPPRILGDFAHGPPRGRFIYVNAGKRAGQTDSCWDRRAKVSLMTITRAQIDAVLAQGGAFLEARIAGTARDGGPACATVPLLDHGWRVVLGAGPRYQSGEQSP